MPNLAFLRYEHKMASLILDTKMSSLALNNQKDFAYDFYKKYLWKELSRNGEESGKVLRTIYRQFGKWCVQKEYMIGDDTETKLFWFKTIVSYLCYEDPCVVVLRHTSSVWSVTKFNETTIISGSGEYQGNDNTVRVWDLPTARENKIKREQAEPNSNK